MKVLLLVTSSPWGSTLGVTALRLARAMHERGMGLAAVFFHEDGVYHAQRCEGPDAESLAAGWRNLAVAASVPLLICQASVQRRLESGACDEAFEQTGLARMLDLAIEADRVVRL